MQGKIILPNEFLSVAEEELKEGRGVKLLADGCSMFPFIRGGQDFAEIIPLPDDKKLERWMVYLFKYRGRYTIHRLIGKEGDVLIMAGDGNINIEEKILREDIIGVLGRIHKSGGKLVDTQSKYWKIKGKIWHRLFPLRKYLLAIFRRLYRYGIIK